MRKINVGFLTESQPGYVLTNLVNHSLNALTKGFDDKKSV